MTTQDQSPISEDREKPVVVDSAIKASGNRKMVEWVVVIVSAVVFALILRTFVIAAFWIPSGSMEPTLEIKDRVLVNKLSYRFGDIDRGDVVVVRRENVLPGQTKDLIKRVVGLPGETIEIRDSVVYINDEALDESDYLDDDVVEADFGPQTIPDNHIFLLGDNRSNSDDSSKGLGTVDTDRVVGRAFVRFWPVGRFGLL